MYDRVAVDEDGTFFVLSKRNVEYAQNIFDFLGGWCSFLFVRFAPRDDVAAAFGSELVSRSDEVELVHLLLGGDIGLESEESCIDESLCL